MKTLLLRKWSTFCLQVSALAIILALLSGCTQDADLASSGSASTGSASSGTTVESASTQLPYIPREQDTQPNNTRVGKLKISENRRYLVDQQDQPFFWLADTAWELFRRLDKAETDLYFQNRVQKGFTVVQAAIVTPLSGWSKPNRQGHSAFEGDIRFPNEAYFAHVDHVVQQAEELGLVMALLPAWSDFAASSSSELSVGDNAYRYGHYLGTRYHGQENIVWVLGGDTNPQENLSMWRGLAQGLKENSDHLVTFHPLGDRTSSTWFHDDSWLDFNMLQSGHGWDNPNYAAVLADYQREPTKPIVDAEPRYENINGIARLGKQRISAHQVRKAAYNAMLSGAFGHTYGANEIWQFYMNNGEDGYDGAGLYGADTHWSNALDFVGAWQMRHLRVAFERYPWYEFEPVHAVVRGGSSAGGGFTPAAVSTKNEAVLIYIPAGQSIELAINDVSLIEDAEWFDPRTGEFSQVDREMIRANHFRPPVQSADPDAADYLLIIKTSLSATGKNAPIPESK